VGKRTDGMMYSAAERATLFERRPFTSLKVGDVILDAFHNSASNRYIEREFTVVEIVGNLAITEYVGYAGQKIKHTFYGGPHATREVKR